MQLFKVTQTILDIYLFPGWYYLTLYHLNLEVDKVIWYIKRCHSCS